MDIVGIPGKEPVKGLTAGPVHKLLPRNDNGGLIASHCTQLGPTSSLLSLVVSRSQTLSKTPRGSGNETILVVYMRKHTRVLLTVFVFRSRGVWEQGYFCLCRWFWDEDTNTCTSLCGQVASCFQAVPPPIFAYCIKNWWRPGNAAMPEGVYVYRTLWEWLLLWQPIQDKTVYNTGHETTMI